MAPVRALESQHDIAGAVEFESFIGDGGPDDVAAPLFQFFVLIHGTAQIGGQAESLFIGTTLCGIRCTVRYSAGHGL